MKKICPQISADLPLLRKGRGKKRFISSIAEKKKKKKVKEREKKR